ncbi:MAG: hypothetical protein KKB70_08790 [Proteobacteria bacterium]|nr:hypothetical protein [Pseudomonadota bacterium]MBU1610356.1 hypothetical protein [Pseudomonadota bacterium]
MTRFRLKQILPVILAAALVLLVAGSALAGLGGHWIFSYRTPDGLAVTAPCSIEEDGSTFTGKASYHLRGRKVIDTMQGKVKPGGQVEFTVLRENLSLDHKGTLSESGQSINGWYKEPTGPGTFTLERVPEKSVYPGLTGKWTYVFLEPGAPPHTAECTMKSFSGGKLTGKIRYPGSTAEALFDGSVNPRGQVTFTMHEAGRAVVHTGLVSDNRRTISGRWQSDWSSGTFTITRQ